MIKKSLQELTDIELEQRYRDLLDKELALKCLLYDENIAIEDKVLIESQLEAIRLEIKAIDDYNEKRLASYTSNAW
jgi:hypothetical protein